MPPSNLYSTVPFLKLLVQERFRNDCHYVWCSEQADSVVRSPYSFASLVPPSSNPADIYRDLKAAVERHDSHNATIVRVKAMYASKSLEWVERGEMTTSDREELMFLLAKDDFKLWRPLLLVIPYAPVATRLQAVPAERRAGPGMEYIIEDLRRSEFDIVEL